MRSRRMPNFTEEQKERLRLWVAALRSGEYKQGRNRLRLEDPVTGEITWCCLGVACDVAEKNGAPVQLHEVPNVFTNPRDKELLSYSYTSSTLSTLSLPSIVSETSLPRVVQQWFGLFRSDPVVRGRHLATWNDHDGADFETIAGYIEEEFGLTEEPVTT
jgi:hypothetical protein